MALCEYCQWIIPEPIWYEGSGDSISHQPTFRALQKSSQQYQLCKLLLTAWMRGQDPGGEFFKLVDKPHRISVVPIEGFMYGGEERFLNIQTEYFRDWTGQKIFFAI
jgi:hypothetical protein